MPVYEYRCEKGHTFEVLQRMSDDPVTDCTTCGTPVQRVFHPVAVHFKGSGFYNTDYGRRNRGGGSSSEESSSSSGDSGSKDSGSQDSGGEGGDKKKKPAEKSGSSGSKSSSSE